MSEDLAALPRWIRRKWWAERYGNVHRSWSPSFVRAAAERKVGFALRAPGGEG